MEDIEKIFGSNQSVFENEVNIPDTNQMIEGELITLNQTPKERNWKFVPIYREGAYGGRLVWQIGFEEKNKNVGNLIIIHGQILTSKGEQGSLQKKYHKVKTNQTGRNIQEQGLLEARRKYIDKWKEGYTPFGEELPAELNYCKPMLANKYRCPKMENGKIKSSNIKKFPVSTMPKIDGIRCLMKEECGKIIARSRLNNMWPHLEHIKKEIKIFLGYLPKNCELDGEIYSFDMTFTELTSVVKTFKKGLHQKHDKLEYFIFDLIDPHKSVWEERYTLLVNALKNYREDGHKNQNFQILQAYTANSHNDILSHHRYFVSQGYEGIMIRKYAGTNRTQKSIKESQYRPNRSNNLLKYKEFSDEEVKIIGGEECEGTEKGAVRFKVLDTRGNEFYVRPRGSVELRIYWMKNLQNLIGKKLTIRYQELSEYGVPRFPVGITIRDYE